MGSKQLCKLGFNSVGSGWSFYHGILGSTRYYKRDRVIAAPCVFLSLQGSMWFYNQPFGSRGWVNAQHNVVASHVG